MVCILKKFNAAAIICPITTTSKNAALTFSFGLLGTLVLLMRYFSWLNIPPSPFELFEYKQL